MPFPLESSRDITLSPSMTNIIRQHEEEDAKRQTMDEEGEERDQSCTRKPRLLNIKSNGDWMRSSSGGEILGVAELNSSEEEEMSVLGSSNVEMVVEEGQGDIIDEELVKPLTLKERITAVFPLLIAIGGSVLFSAVQLNVKLLSEKFTSFELGLHRSLVQGVWSAIALYWHAGETPFDLKREYWWPIAMRGLFGFFSFTALFYSLSKLPMSESIVISFTHPVIVAILAAMFLKEKWQKIDALGAFLCMLGVVLIARPPFLFPELEEDKKEGSTMDHWLGVGAGVLSSIFTSINICLTRSMGTKVNALQNLVWFSIISSIAAIPGIFIELGLNWHIPVGKEWAMLSSVGSLAFLGQWSIIKALQMEKAAIIATTGYIQVVFSTVNQKIFFQNTPPPLSLAGVGLICSWAIISLLKQWEKEQKVSWFTKMRLRLMKSSLDYQKLHEAEKP